MKTTVGAGTVARYCCTWRDWQKSVACGRLEWSVLDWNQPAIDFYKKLGASPMSDWTVFRITGRSLDELAEH